ncbi:MAG TPA: peptidylprolyl isomerase [Terriglobales bacterium]|nr:peptidylprolyl isomerase [Terriglobales bacterium]
MLRHLIRSGLFLVIVLSLSFPAGLHAKMIERLITVIDGEPYTLSNVDAFAKTRMGRDFPTGRLDPIDGNDRDVLERFITDKLLEAEIRDAGIKIGDADVDAYIEQIKEKNHLSDEDLKRALEREGQTLTRYRATVKSELEKSELINLQVKKKVNITDDDVERYYKLNAKNYRAQDRVRLRHILLPLAENASPEEVKAVMARAEELYQRIQGGDAFGAVAQQYSDGAGREDGGDIGWVNRGTLLKPIEEVAFNKLSVGEVSRPIRSSLGIHLVKLEDKEVGALLPLSAVKSKIKEELYAKALEERFDAWLKTDLRRKHAVEVKIPGVEFKPEDSKQGTVDSLMARSARLDRGEKRTFLSYLNPLSYFVKENPIDEEDATAPLVDKSIVSVFGIPMFTKDAPDDVPDLLSAPADPSGGGEAGGAEPPAEDGSTSKKSGGFSSVVDSLNPFTP